MHALLLRKSNTLFEFTNRIQRLRYNHSVEEEACRIVWQKINILCNYNLGYHTKVDNNNWHLEKKAYFLCDSHIIPKFIEN